MKRKLSGSWSSLSLLLLVMVAAAPAANAGDAPKLAPALQPFVDDHSLAGAVLLVADGNQILNLEAVGWMDIAARKPMRTDSLF
jgi:hypothetical protein